MTVIDTHNNISHENCSEVKAAEIVGVSRMQIHRWKERGFEVFNHFHIYFNVRQHRHKPRGLSFKQQSKK